MLRPKLLETIAGYTVRSFLSDLLAGCVVAIVALPLAIAFAIASGVTPELGIWSAIIGGFVISLLGGSRVQIGGPTGAFVILVGTIVHQVGLNGLWLCTILAGGMLILMGMAKLGHVIKFIPHSVILGFTSGIAILIFGSQIPDALGIGSATVPANFFARIAYILERASSISLTSGVLTALTIGIIIVFPTRFLKIPGSLVAIGVTAIAVHSGHLPVETIGSRFGEFMIHVPVPSVPTWDFSLLGTLLKPAFAIAFLAGTESLLSAVVADGMIFGNHRSNMELVAQGIANVGVGFFGGLPVTGAIARTATNIRSGGRTPVAGIVHAGVLLILVLCFGRWITAIPLPALAGILMVVAYHMGEWRNGIGIIRTSFLFAIVYVTTVGVTVCVDLITAIEIGLLLAVLVFIREMSITTQIMPIEEDDSDRDDPPFLAQLSGDDREKMRIYEIQGPLFFGAAYKLKETLMTPPSSVDWIILRMDHMVMIDSTGIQALTEAIDHLQERQIHVVLVGVNARVFRLLLRSGLVNKIGKPCFTRTVDQAIVLART